MNSISRFIFLFIISIIWLPSCKKPSTPPVITLTTTNDECQLTGTIDSNAWTNDVLHFQTDTALLIFNDNISFFDSIAAVVHISPPCPNPSNGFFFWNVSSNRECKLKLVCVDGSGNILYYNAYKLQGGHLEIGFDFSSATAFHKGSNYEMFYGFYTSNDSVFYSGYGYFGVQ